MSKKTIIKCLAGAITLSLIFSFIIPWAVTGEVGKSVSMMTFSFGGIGKGLDPKGNNFNINDLKSDAVLKSAIKACGMEKSITPNELRRLIAIKPVVSSNSLTKITSVGTVTGNTSSIHEKSLFPNQYIIELKDKKLPEPMNNNKLLKATLKSYNAFLKQKYVSNTISEPIFSKEELTTMDYPEMITALEQEADNLIRYVKSFKNSANQYVSKEEGIAFSDLLKQSETIKSIDVASLDGLVNYYSVTKDVDYRKNLEQSLIKRAKLLERKAGGIQYTIEEIASVYDNTTNFLFAPTGDSLQAIEMKENEFYNQLMNSLIESKTNTINARYVVNVYENNLAKLNSLNTPKRELEQKGDEILQGITNVYSKMDNIKESTVALAKEQYAEEINTKIANSNVKYKTISITNLLVYFVIFLALILLAKALIWQNLKHNYTKRFFEKINLKHMHAKMSREE